MTTNAVSVITSRNVVLRSLRQHMAGTFCFFDSQSFNTTFDRRGPGRPAPRGRPRACAFRRALVEVAARPAAWVPSVPPGALAADVVAYV